jgi:hypothetical protein
VSAVAGVTALAGPPRRYPWQLLRPVVGYLVEQVLRDYEAESALEVRLRLLL